jgi:hypothetical protein
MKGLIKAKNASASIFIVNRCDDNQFSTALEMCKNYSLKLISIKNCALSHAYLPKYYRTLTRSQEETRLFLDQIAKHSTLRIASSRRVHKTGSLMSDCNTNHHNLRSERKDELFIHQSLSERTGLRTQTNILKHSASIPKELSERGVVSTNHPRTPTANKPLPPLAPDVYAIPTRNKFALLSGDKQTDCEMPFSPQIHLNSHIHANTTKSQSEIKLSEQDRTLFGSHQRHQQRAFRHNNNAHTETLTPVEARTKNQNHSTNAAVNPICTRVCDTIEGLKKSLKLEPAPTKADGHCLLYAVANQLDAESDNIWNYQSLKDAIKTEGIKNKHKYANFIEKSSGDLVSLMNTYINEKLFDHAAGDLIPQIISNVTRKQIHIFNERDNGIWKTIVQPTTNVLPNSQPVHIHRKSDHYSALLNTDHRNHFGAPASL